MKYHVSIWNLTTALNSVPGAVDHLPQQFGGERPLVGGHEAREDVVGEGQRRLGGQQHTTFTQRVEQYHKFANKQ